MYIKYSPCQNPNIETQFYVKDDYTIVIDNEEYVFDIDSVTWPDIASQTNGVIIEAHKEDNTIYVTIQRYYKESCPWDDSKYHEVFAR